jgi:cytochrome c
MTVPFALLAAVPAERLSIGRAASAAEIARWDIDVGPDGAGLPTGSATARDGQPVFAAKCAACHGEDGRRGRDKLAGDADNRDDKTIASYWPFATTVFDYVRRAMPPAAPGSLTDRETYALTAYLLFLNGLIDADEVIDAATLPTVDMPARDRFVTDDRRGGDEVR